MDLKDRKILITGANGGLGRAMAAAMAEGGTMLALCERTQALADAAKAALLEPARAQAHAFAADLTDADAVAAMVSDSAAALQGLDGLVNNAAILADDDTDPVATSLESWRATLDVNVTGAFLMCKNVLPLFVSQKRGAIVTLSSVVAHSASATSQIAYTTSKGALEAMTRDIAVAMRATIFAQIASPRSRSHRPQPALFRHARKMADAATPYSDGTAGRRKSCRLVCFLLSDEAGWQTGGVYRVDGGISAAYVVDDRDGSESP